MSEPYLHEATTRTLALKCEQAGVDLAETIRFHSADGQHSPEAVRAALGKLTTDELRVLKATGMGPIEYLLARDTPGPTAA